MGAIEVPADSHAKARASAAAGLLAELQRHALEDDDIVEANGALFLMAQDEIQVDGAERHEGRVRVRRRAGELGVVVGDEVVAQVGVGGLDGGDAGHAEFVDESALQGAIEPLAAAAALGGVAGDVLDPQARERAPECVGRVRSTLPPAVGV